jgi:hypothetical protein
MKGIKRKKENKKEKKRMNEEIKNKIKGRIERKQKGMKGTEKEMKNGKRDEGIEEE